MPAYRFRVGQTVLVLSGGPQGAIPPGPYVIVRLLPMEDGEPHYRVRSSIDSHERALLEGQMKLQEPEPTKVEAPQTLRPRSRGSSRQAGRERSRRAS
jgi:hypothetical protein